MAEKKTKRSTKKTAVKEKVDEEKQKRLLMLAGQQFITREQMAELAGIAPEKIQEFVDGDPPVIPPDCYCYPSTVAYPGGDGHQRMFLPKKTLEALKKA